MHRILVLIGSIALTLLLSCRENPVYFAETGTVDRIDGVVRDRFRNPIPGVNVRVYFDYQVISYEPEPNRSLDITADGMAVRVIVSTLQNEIRRILYVGTPPRGTFFVAWDGRDSAGVRVPSGVYRVRYLVQDTVAAEYTVGTDGGIVTKTDSAGYYSIERNSLPLNYSPVPLYSSNGNYFYGNCRISRTVGLLFETAYAESYFETTLFEGSGSRVNVVLE